MVTFRFVERCCFNMQLNQRSNTLACCRFRGHEDWIVTKELEIGYDETKVRP
jgi:hypothetical protein